MEKRKIFLGLSIAALALASCSQSELTADAEFAQAGKDRSISFGSYLSRPTSRAAGVDLAGFQADGRFKVFGYVTQDAAGNSADLTAATGIALHTALSHGSALDGTDEFKRVATDETNTAYIWSSVASNKYYWPSDGLGKMTFYALSNRTGYSSSKVVLDSITAPTSTVGAKFTYTVGTNGTTIAADKQEDLMAAQVYDKVWATDNATSQIMLDFKHLLTQVRFAAKTSDQSYRVKILSLKVTGATNQGTFTFDISNAGIGSWEYPADATKDNYVYFDATASGAQNADFANGFPKDDTTDPTKHFVGLTAVDFPLFGAYTTDVVPVPDVKQALIVLPSVGKDAANGNAALGLKGVTISVSYQCYILSGLVGEEGAAVSHWVPDGTVLNRTIELTDNEMWTMNKKVCYTLTLFNSAAGKIDYNTNVTEWSDQTGDSNLYPDKDYVPEPVVP